MTKEQKETIIAEYKAGACLARIKAKTGIHENTIRTALSRWGFSVHFLEDDLKRKERSVLYLYELGWPKKKIRDVKGLGKATYRAYEKFDLKLQENWQREQEKVEAEARMRKRLKEKRLEYVSGYVFHQSIIKIKCVECGRTFERTVQLVKAGTIFCPYCKEKKTTAEKDQRAKREEYEKRVTKIAKDAKRFCAGNQITWDAGTVNKCCNCGEKFFQYDGERQRQFCKMECSRAFRNRAKLDRRIKKLNACMVDKSITLRGVYERDGGICYLCGTPCDYSDIKEERGALIAGNNYPSIDHVVPLAAGGAHKWGNVRLAHRRCNSIKGAIPPPSCVMPEKAV